MPDADLTATTAESLTRLESLAAELAVLGWPAGLDQPPGRLPSVYVRNPEPARAPWPSTSTPSPGTTAAGPTGGPWAQAIDGAGPAGAAAAITRALRAAG